MNNEKGWNVINLWEKGATVSNLGIPFKNFLFYDSRISYAISFISRISKISTYFLQKFYF
jgi:hypothetical protein